MDRGDAAHRADALERSSEKIARLTRVVARLHAACEEHEREKASAMRAYARDVALSRHEASEAMYREMANRERAEANALASRAGEAVAEAKARCVSAERREAEEGARAKIRIAVEEFSERERAREAAVEARMASMKAACELEREATERARAEALRAESEARRRIVADARAMEATLKSEVMFERAERARAEEEFERETELARAAHAVAVAKINAEAEAIKERSAEDIREKTAEMERFKAECEETVARERATAREKYERQRSAYEFLEKSLAETASELECTRRAHEACRQSLDDACASAVEREKIIMDVRSKLSDTEAAFSAQKVEVERLSVAQGELAQKLSESQHAYASSMEDRVTLEEAIQDEKRARRDMEEEYITKVRKLEETITSVRDAAAQCQAEAEQAARASQEKFEHLLNEFDRRNQKAEAESQELVLSYEARIKAIEVENAAQILHVRTELIERSRAAEVAHSDAVRALESSWMSKEQRWEHAKRRLESELERITWKESEANNLLEAQHVRNGTLVADIERIRTDAKAREAIFVDEAREAKLALHAVEAMAHKLEQTLSERERAHASDVAELEKKTCEDMERLNALWEQKTREHVSVALEESNRAHESAMNRLASEMELRAKQDIARAVANVSEAYHGNERELREEIEALIREHSAKEVAAAVKHKKEIDELRVDFQDRLRSMSSAHICEIERLSAAHTERLAVMQSEHESHARTSKEDAVRLALREFEDQYEARAKEVAQNTAIAHAQELQRSSDEYSKELALLEREYESKIESCIAVSATLELERESLRTQLRRAREELSTSESERAVEEERFRDTAAAAAYAHESEIEALRKEHRSVVARMQDVNETAARVANDALAASRAEISKWKAMYETRESRPEDLRRIQQLESDLIDANERLDRSAAHRRQLQSELLGRATDVEWSAGLHKGSTRRSRQRIVI